MKAKTIFFSLLLALVSLGPMQAVAQEDEDVRGAFLTTRPKASSQPKPAPTSKPNRRRPKPGPKNTPMVPGVAPASDPNAGAPGKPIAQRMGLGLTLFMRNSNGMAVRTDPSREFQKGDRVRVLLETNADGYLYIFNTTDDGKPVMIYPDLELDDAGNFIQGHIPFEIPSSVAAEERLRWFSFDQNAGIERLYFVFTRELLAAVPIEDDLITYCRENTSKCPWRPGTDLWAQIQKETSEPTQVAKGEKFGKAQTSAEQQAATRGIGLNRDDPEPSLIMLTASTSKSMLVATLELQHKSASVVVE